MLLSACLLLIFVARAAPPTSADERVNNAIKAAQAVVPLQAIPLLEAAEAKHPFHPANVQILFLLGSLYVDVEEFDKAQASFEKLDQRYGKYAASMPQVDEARVAMARVLSGKGKHDAALAQLDAFLKQNPKSAAAPMARYLKGEVLVKKGDLAAARTYLEPVANNPSDRMYEAALFMLAELAVKAKDSARAEAIMSQLLKTTKDRDARNNALFKLGEIYRDGGNVPKALDAFRRVKSAGTDAAARNMNANILLEIGQTFEKLKHPLEARIAFEGIATLYPDSMLATDAWHRAILADVDFDDVARAEARYLLFLSNYPGMHIASGTRMYLANHELQAERFTNAIHQLQSGLREFPTSEWVETMYTTLGSAFLAAKKYREAEATLKEFADKFPGSELVPESYLMLADGYAEQERFEPAIETYERVANDYGGVDAGKAAGTRAQEARLQYGAYLAATNDLVEAVRQFKTVTASNLIEQALFMMAGALAQAKQYDEAVAELHDFMTRFPDSPLRPEVLSRLADIQMQGEQYTEAAQTLQELFALPIAPTNPILPAANLQLAFCKYYQDDNAGMGVALTNILARYPQAPEAGEALYWLAYLKRTQQEYRAAGELYQQLLRRYPQHPYAAEAAYQAGETALMDNNAGGAVMLFTNVYGAYADSVFAPYALVRAGEIYLGLHQLPAWLLELDALPATSASQRAARTLARAAILMRAADFSNAATVLATLPLAQLPAPLQGYAMAVGAGIHNGKGAAAQALDAAKQAMALLQDAPVGRDEALFHRGRAEQALNNWEAAEKTYATLLADVTIPNNAIAAEAAIDRAECLMKLERNDEVIAVVDQGIKLRPPVELAARGVVMKGDAMLQQNEYQKAAQFYKRAVILYGKLERFAVPAYHGLIVAYTKLGLTEEAAQAKQQFAQQYPKAAQP